MVAATRFGEISIDRNICAATCVGVKDFVKHLSICGLKYAWSQIARRVHVNHPHQEACLQWNNIDKRNIDPAHDQLLIPPTKASTIKPRRKHPRFPRQLMDENLDCGGVFLGGCGVRVLKSVHMRRASRVYLSMSISSTRRGKGMLSLSNAGR